MDRRVAIYPGSFNPWHEGHDDILRKALKVFDQVLIAVGHNPEKPESNTFEELKKLHGYGIKNKYIRVVKFEGLLADAIQKENKNRRKIHAVIRGLRNGQDLEYEKTQQYWNEDLKIGIPTMYFIASRDKVHLSSSAIRVIEKFKGENDG